MMLTMTAADAIGPPAFSGGSSIPNNRPPQPVPQPQPELQNHHPEHLPPATPEAYPEPKPLEPGKYPPGVQPVQIFPLAQVTEEMWDRFVAGRLGDVAIECPKGAELPVFFKLNTNLFSLVNEPKEPIRLKVERRFFVRFPGTDFLFSLDTVEWWGFPHFFKGHLHTDFDIMPTGPEVCLEFDLVR
jgi:hypothetical protein